MTSITAMTDSMAMGSARVHHLPWRGYTYYLDAGKTDHPCSQVRRTCGYRLWGLRVGVFVVVVVVVVYQKVGL